MKEYACTQWPFYDLGKGIKFEDGRFATADPGQQEIIELNDKYMVFIWPVSPSAKEEVPVDKAGEGGVPTPQQDDREAVGTCEVEPGSGLREGRETSNVLQELENIVLGSGIIGKVEGKQAKSPHKAAKRS
jgi:hypothetical protein